MDSTQIIIFTFFDFMWAWDVTALYQDKTGEWHGERFKTMTKSKRIGENRENWEYWEVHRNYILKPKKNWPVVINKLLKLKIDVLPNMADIPNTRYRSFDGQIHTFTFRHTYINRTVEYHNPQFFKRKSWQTNYASKIVKVPDKYLIKQLESVN